MHTTPEEDVTTSAGCLWSWLLSTLTPDVLIEVKVRRPLSERWVSLHLDAVSFLATDALFDLLQRLCDFKAWQWREREGILGRLVEVGAPEAVIRHQHTNVAESLAAMLTLRELIAARDDPGLRSRLQQREWREPEATAHLRLNTEPDPPLSGDGLREPDAGCRPGAETRGETRVACSRESGCARSLLSPSTGGNPSLVPICPQAPVPTLRSRRFTLSTEGREGPETPPAATRHSPGRPAGTPERQSQT